MIAIAVIIGVVIFLTSVTIYSGIWPPVDTIASESMTHSDYWTYGTMNVGDIVFVKKVSSVPGPVITYVVGRQTGFSTYGEYGNVILYKNPEGQTIIHRAMFYLSWNDGMPIVQGFHDQSWMKVTKTYVLITLLYILEEWLMKVGSSLWVISTWLIVESTTQA